ncbi:MAG TPA: hypothetical protein P5203_16850 [Spirochaetota bacterium]|nr:hypothetical protein [Spirochaetota bacterium]HRT76782.1 hypothetical protein [Spirochaetota bacterium]
MTRRKTIIDKNFQLKTTFRIIGIIIIAFILIIAVTGIISSDNNRQISATITDLNASIEKNKKTIETLMTLSAQKRDTAASHDQDRAIEEHMETIALMHTNVEQLKRILNLNRVLFTVMIITGVLLGLGLFLYLIRLTNRMSGPLYVLTQHMHDIMSGRKPNLRELRKNDEFQGFYRQFIAFIDEIGRK